MNKPDRTPEEIQKDAQRFEQLRHAARVVLNDGEGPVTDEELAKYLGIGNRNVRRYVSGIKVPRESMIRHFWTAVFREANEGCGPTLTLGEFFREVDWNVQMWGASHGG